LSIWHALGMISAPAPFFLFHMIHVASRYNLSISWITNAWENNSVTYEFSPDHDLLDPGDL